MAKTAVAVRHVHFETLGTFEQVLADAGYDLSYLDAGQDALTIDATKPDLLVMLGGPIGVYETDIYPVLLDELALIRARLASGKPLIGICLGAQLIAAALGAKVAATGINEIGFSPLTLTEQGAKSPLRHLDGVHVLHWHGDAFAIPHGAAHLASTPVCATQAFALGSNVLGLQFHPEADTTHDLEPWLIGHAAELAGAKIDPRVIRQDARCHGPALAKAARAMFAEWLASTT